MQYLYGGLAIGAIIYIAVWFAFKSWSIGETTFDPYAGSHKPGEMTEEDESEHGDLG